MKANWKMPKIIWKQCEYASSKYTYVIVFGLTRPTVTTTMFGLTRPTVTTTMFGLTRPTVTTTMFGLTRPTVTATMLQELLTFRSTQVHPWFWVEFVLLDLLCVIYCRSFFVFVLLTFAIVLYVLFLFMLSLITRLVSPNIVVHHKYIHFKCNTVFLFFIYRQYPIR